MKKAEVYPNLRLRGYFCHDKDSLTKKDSELANPTLIVNRRLKTRTKEF